MLNKGFNQKTCDEHDPKGRARQRAILENVFDAVFIGSNESESTGDLGYWDQEFSIGDLRFKADAESRNDLYDGSFLRTPIANIGSKVIEWRYPVDPEKRRTIHIPARKGLSNHLSSLYVSTGEWFAFLCSRVVCNGFEPRRVQCHNNQEGQDWFYDIPLNVGLFVYRTKSGLWKWLPSSQLTVSQLLEQIEKSNEIIMNTGLSQ